MCVTSARLLLVFFCLIPQACFADARLGECPSDNILGASCDTEDAGGEGSRDVSLGLLQSRSVKLFAAEFPKMPAFTASIVEQQQTFAQFPGEAPSNPHYSGGIMKYDPAGAGNVMVKLNFHTYNWVSPKFADLWTKQVCINGECTYLDRNGTVSGHGVNNYLVAWFQLFDQLPSKGQRHGVSKVGGQACDLWSIQNASVGNLSMCLGPDFVPRSLVVEPAGDAAGWSNIKEWAHNITFHEIRVGKIGVIERLSVEVDRVPPDKFTIPCASPGGEKSVQVLRGSSPPEKLGVLADRDTFDWIGQGVTLGSPKGIKFVYKKYLQVFDVDFDGHFGIWRDCNYNKELEKYICPRADISKMPYTAVTRSSAEQLSGKVGMGMCDENSEVGSWLTFPHEGKCADNASVGDAGCTWKLKTSKVILMDCMVHFNSSGWIRSWSLDFGRAPFPHVIAHVKAAVQACPDVREESASRGEDAV